MSAATKTSERVADALRDEASTLDELTRARLERQILSARTAPAASAGCVDAARSMGPRRVGALVVGGSVALAAAAAAFLAFRSPEAPRYTIMAAAGVAAGGSATNGGAVVPSSGTVQAGTELALAAGESASVELFDLGVTISERSRLRVEAVSLEDVRVSLASGEARFAFHPRNRGHQHVAIATPAARVEIVGTELTVRVTDLGTEVTVHEGVVRVIPADGSGREVEMVEAGHAVSVPVLVAAVEPAPEVGSPVAANDGLATGVDPEAIEMDAVETPSSTELSSATGSVASASAELLARAEALLDRGNYESAERILVPIAEGPGARSVHLEAWTLLGDARGARHDHAGALSAWEHVIGLSRGTSRANAIYERTRVLREMHDVEGERAELARYLGEFPNGPNAGSARTRLCSLGGADGVECE